MTLDEAFRIIRILGRYIEYCQDRLQALFLISIPESSLPYRKEILKDAINIVAKYYYDIGDFEKCEYLQKKVFGRLCLYDKDEEVLKRAALKYNDPKLREVIISKMQIVQKNWIKTQEDG